MPCVLVYVVLEGVKEWPKYGNDKIENCKYPRFIVQIINFKSSSLIKIFHSKIMIPIIFCPMNSELTTVNSNLLPQPSERSTACTKLTLGMPALTLLSNNAGVMASRVVPSQQFLY